MPKRSSVPNDHPTADEVRVRSQLTHEEAKVVKRLTDAVRMLSPFLSLTITEEGLEVHRRVTQRYAVRVAKVRKKSICF